MEVESVFSNTNLANDFARTSEKISHLLNDHEILLKPYLTESLPHFSKLTEAEKLAAIKSLKTYLDICEHMLVAGKSLVDTPSHVWFALKAFGLRPPSDLFQYIGAGHVIEVHLATGIQIFRNFEFYKHCSYTLEDLYCRPWTELYQHDPKMMAELMKLATFILNGTVKNPVAIQSQAYLIEELFSEKRLHIRSRFHYASPLYDENGTAVAYLSIETAESSISGLKAVSPSKQPESLSI